MVDYDRAGRATYESSTALTTIDYLNNDILYYRLFADPLPLKRWRPRGFRDARTLAAEVAISGVMLIVSNRPYKSDDFIMET